MRDGPWAEGNVSQYKYFMLIKHIISEQVGQEVTRPTSLALARKNLEKFGYHEIGHGGYATVFASDKSTYVLKLFEKNDLGYRTFIKIATSTNNKHFPQFRGKMIRVSDRYNAIRMEKLHPLTYSTRLEGLRVVDLIQDTFTYFQTTQNSLEDFLSEERPEYQDYFVNFSLAKNFYNKHPDLYEACELIVKMSNSHVFTDLQAANIMLRDNGDIVITDPLVGED